MFGNLPFCGNIPIVKGHRINILSKNWSSREDIEFLALILLAQVMKTNFTIYEAEAEIKLSVIDLNNSHLKPLRKHSGLPLVS